ncbi:MULTISPECIES: hypothetical protein [unclassified Microcoleus]|uniref:hypothetical protein n=1 Tax=unclassified Microcoleus TaxID=2642155 RepID=UPI0025FA67CC|nr:MULTISPECIES: hypothetical protein [unclassified Microcoleus]
MKPKPRSEEIKKRRFITQILFLLSQMLSTVNCQLSTVNCQPSTVNCQLSTVNCQLNELTRSAGVKAECKLPEVPGEK